MFEMSIKTQEIQISMHLCLPPVSSKEMPGSWAPAEHWVGPGHEIPLGS